MRYSRLHNLLILTVFLLMVTTPVLAEKNIIELPSLGEPQFSQWQRVDKRMEHREYRSVIRHNKRIIARYVKNHIEDQFIDIGVSKRSARLTISGVAFLFEGKAKIRLTNNDALALEVRDLVEDDRAMLFRFKLNW